MASPDSDTVHIGTRRSALALKQVDMIVEALQKAHPQTKFEVHAVSVAGDRDKTTPLPALGKGLWTTELEAQLLAKDLDMLVHCVKDMPTKVPEGCALGAITEREDPRDVVIFKNQEKHQKLVDLPDGSVVGTSSVRRASQLRRRYPGLVFKDVRGNIDTRLRKLDTEGFDCIILAAAGMKRMGFDSRIGQFLDSHTEGGGLLYAVGQGALGIEIREGDSRVLSLLQSIVHMPTTLEASAERALMRTLEGGCSVPIGVESSWVEGQGARKLRMKAVVVSLDGADMVEADIIAEVTDLAQADALGKQLAQDLVGRGAQNILDVINKGREGNAGALKVGDA